MSKLKLQIFENTQEQYKKISQYALVPTIENVKKLNNPCLITLDGYTVKCVIEEDLALKWLNILKKVGTQEIEI